MKTAKEILKERVLELKDKTGKSQEELSTLLGYKPKGLTQAISKKEGHEAVIKRLELLRERLIKEMSDKDNSSSVLQDQSLLQVLERIAVALEAIAWPDNSSHAQRQDSSDEESSIEILKKRKDKILNHKS